MRRLRALLVAFTVLAVVLGTMGTAFAAGITFKDVPSDASYAQAVSRLSALKIIVGDDKGNFNPDNPITRAEFATIAVRAAGIESAASAFAGQTRFSDVPANHWAAGYINAATTAGLLVGYPDGTFKPEQQVTQAEALTILVRALGFGPVVKGEWPNNYVNQAAALGISEGVSVVAGLPATRAIVAQFVDNSLDIKKLEQRGFGDLAFYEQGDKTLLDGLGVTVYDTPELLVVANGRVDDNLAADEVTIRYVGTDSDVDFGEKDFVVAGYNTDELLGQFVTFWAKGNTIVYAKVTTPSSRNISDTAVLDDTSNNSFDWDATNKTGVLHGDDDDYDVTEDSIIYFNNEPKKPADLASDFDGADIRVTLDRRGNVAFADIVEWTNILVVSDVDEDDNAVTGWDFKNSQEETIVLDEDAETSGGVAVSAKDFSAGDILYFRGDTFVLKAGKVVEGELDEVIEGSTAGSVSKVVIDGTEYKVDSSWRFAEGALDKVKSTDADGLAEAAGAAVKAYVGKNDKVLLVLSEAEVGAASQVGVLVGKDTPNVGASSATILTADDEIVEFDLTKDARTAIGSINAPALVTYKVNSDGKIDEIAQATGSGTIPNGYNGSNVVNGYRVRSDTKVFVVTTTSNPWDTEVRTGSDLFDASTSAVVNISFKLDGRDYDAILVVNPGTALAWGTPDEDFAVVTSVRRTASPKLSLIKEDGSSVTLAVDEDEVTSSVYRGRVISYDLNSAGDLITKVSVQTGTSVTLVSASKVDTTGEWIDVDGTVGGNDLYFLSDNAVIYDAVDNKKISLGTLRGKTWDLVLYDTDTDTASYEFVVVTDHND